MTMTRFPYVKQALYVGCLEYLCEEGLTPYLEVSTAHPEYIGPRDTESKRGFTVFNISANALVSYLADENGLAFGAKFQGLHRDVFIPWAAIARIYAKEDVKIIQNFVFDMVPTSDVDSVVAPLEEEPKIKLVHSTDKPKPSGKARRSFRPKLVE
jgi:stringent starvation protein B